MYHNGTPTRRCRIAHLTLGLEVGGQEKLLVEFARHAACARCELFFVSLGGRGPLARQIESCGWPVFALDEPPGLRPALIFRLARLLRRLRVDVVHTHDDKPLLYGAPAARLARVPFVVHTKHYGQVAHIGRRHRLLASWAARLTDRFVCVSEDSMRLTMNHGIPAARLATIWNGIDLARFASPGPCANGPVVTVARLSPEKDVVTLLRAAALAIRDLPDLHVEIAGGGSCLAELQHLAAELGLDARVQFLGAVNDVPRLLARAGLFVLPSYTEGLSLSILEAMACGVPVVAAHVGGNPELVRHGETGLLVPPRDPAALAGAIVQLQRDADLRRRMGQAGRQRAEAHFDVRRMVADYERLYAELGAARTLQLASAKRTTETSASASSARSSSRAGCFSPG